MSRSSIYFTSTILIAIFVPNMVTGLPSGANEHAEAGQETSAVVFGQEEIPEYLVVSSLFRRAAAMLRQDHDFFKNFIGQLGLEPDSPKTDLFIEAVLEAEKALDEPTFDPSLTGAAFMDYQYVALGEKARKLATIYHNLLDRLDVFPSKAGINSSSKVRDYCLEQVRPSLTVSSSELDNQEFLEAVAEFDRQLSLLTK